MSKEQYEQINIRRINLSIYTFLILFICGACGNNPEINENSNITENSVIITEITEAKNDNTDKRIETASMLQSNEASPVYYDIDKSSLPYKLAQILHDELEENILNPGDYGEYWFEDMLSFGESYTVADCCVIDLNGDDKLEFIFVKQSPGSIIWSELLIF